MAYTSQAFFFVMLAFLALQTVAGRNIPTDSKLHPEFKGFDGTVLIPGIGRVMVPKKGQHPFHYNPTTGAPKRGFSIPGVGDLTGGAGRRTSLPGRDDTTLPNPIGRIVPAPPAP